MDALKRFLLLSFAGLLSAQQLEDPIKDKLRYELTAAQRDYYLGQLQMEKALQRLRTKIAEAQALCGTERDFNIETLTCSARAVQKN